MKSEENKWKRVTIGDNEWKQEKWMKAGEDKWNGLKRVKTINNWWKRVSGQKLAGHSQWVDLKLETWNPYAISYEFVTASNVVKSSNILIYILKVDLLSSTVMTAMVWTVVAPVENKADWIFDNNKNLW